MIFTVIDRIRGKGRPRFGGGHAYTDRRTREYEAHIAEEYRISGGKLYDVAVSIRVAALFSVPKKTSKKDKELTKKKKYLTPLTIMTL